MTVSLTGSPTRSTIGSERGRINCEVADPARETRQFSRFRQRSHRDCHRIGINQFQARQFTRKDRSHPPKKLPDSNPCAVTVMLPARKGISCRFVDEVRAVGAVPGATFDALLREAAIHQDAIADQLHLRQSLNRSLVRGALPHAHIHRLADE